MSRSIFTLLIAFSLGSCTAAQKERIVSEVEFIAFDVLYIDSSESVPALIRAGHYDETELRILDSGPPLSNGPRCGAYNCVNRRWIQLARFNGSYSTTYIAERFRARGLRPANAQELVTFGNANPRTRWFYPIVALGSVWQTEEGDTYVAVLGHERGKRSVYLHWSVETWPSCYRFLATREERH